MKNMLRSVCIVILVSSSFVAFNGCGSGNNSTTSSDSSTTTDTVGTMNKMSDSSSMNRMADSTTANDTGGRNTQNVPPPKPKGQ